MWYGWFIVDVVEVWYMIDRIMIFNIWHANEMDNFWPQCIEVFSDAVIDFWIARYKITVNLRKMPSNSKEFVGNVTILEDG